LPDLLLGALDHPLLRIRSSKRIISCDRPRARKRPQTPRFNQLWKRYHVAQVVATADARSDVAVRWLKRLGFQPAEHQQIAGKLLFVWNQESGIRHQGSRVRKGSTLLDT
jgi:hypothetical protein